MPCEFIVLVPAAILSLVFPLAIVMIRQTVKRQRQEVIRDLAAVFNLPNMVDDLGLIPSFEFVKFKYFLSDERKLAGGLGGVSRATAGRMAPGEAARSPQDFYMWAWIVGLAPFVLVTSAISWFSFAVLFQVQLPPPLSVLIADVASPPLWALAVTAAFLGAYLCEMRELYRAINNFDLSPSLFVCSAIDMAGGVALAILVSKSFGDLFPAMELTTGAVLLLSFAIGFLPSVTVREVIYKSRLSSFKRESPEIYKNFTSTPVEIIDGIDTGIRDRLEDYHITSVQNLAAANPLMLFVEAPYGVYQIMDWVAQAQLCSSVGASAIVRLWKLGVRTLFDLERIALDPRYYSKELVLAVGAAMIEGSVDKNGSLVFDELAIKANIQIRLDDPHVHRLRQIYMQVGDRIGRQHSRFLNTEPLWSVTWTSVRFASPNFIRDTGNRLGAFRVGDKILIQGGVNNAKIFTVEIVGASELRVKEDVLPNSQDDIVTIIRF